MGTVGGGGGCRGGGACHGCYWRDGGAAGGAGGGSSRGGGHYPYGVFLPDGDLKSPNLGATLRYPKLRSQRRSRIWVGEGRRNLANLRDGK